MKQKEITTIVLMAVLIIGAVAIVGLLKATGAVSAGDRQCICEITQTDYYGRASNVLQLPVSVQTAQEHTDPACKTLCVNHYGSPRTGVTGYKG